MRKYDKGFQEEAVKLSDEVGVKQAAAQLGVPYYTLAEWRQKRNYGVGRILLALRQRGITASRSTVRRAMKKGGLLKAPARLLRGPIVAV